MTFIGVWSDKMAEATTLEQAISFLSQRKYYLNYRYEKAIPDELGNTCPAARADEIDHVLAMLTQVSP
jgi:hypothetical protein